MTRPAAQLAAMERTRDAVAVLGPARVTTDTEGWSVIPGRFGQIEWYCDGADCHGCRLPGFALAVYTGRLTAYNGHVLPGQLLHRGADGVLH